MRKVALYWGTANAIPGLLAVKVKEASCPTRTELETCWLTAIDGPIAAADVAPTVRKPATTLMVTRKANVARRCARANKPMDWPLTNSPGGKGQMLKTNNTKPLRLNPPTFVHKLRNRMPRVVPQEPRPPRHQRHNSHDAQNSTADDGRADIEPVGNRTCAEVTKIGTTGYYRD